MKRIAMMLILLSMFIVVGCTSDKEVYSKTVLSDNIPNFVREGNFETIDSKEKP